ncbi:MAG: CBS domain-containing protein [Proteobacteria bacterium]|jgi:magnesium and cobalt transporter|nr:CBS domain-containing protein [Pseudomonadota bacterium]
MKSWLSSIFAQEPQNKQEMITLLRDAATRKIIDNDSLPMLEAVLAIDDLKARDIMIPRQQMDVIDASSTIDDIIEKIVNTGHSRFPVINGEISEVIGVFHSKDLIQHFKQNNSFDIKQYLRHAYFVPEIKRLDSLMYEMRMNHTHLVIVVDEFTNVVGLITLEMIIEQIIGDIEDEYDSVEGERLITEIKEHQYRVKGYCKLSELNLKLGLLLDDNIVETIGGFLIKFLGRIPAVGEILDFKHMKIEVISADSRKINLLLLHLHQL